MKTYHLFLIIFSFFISSSYSQIYDKKQIDESNLNSDTIKNRLERLNAKTPIELYFTPSVEKTIKRYLNTRLEFYKKNIDRINYYLPIFEEQLQNQKIPLEIKYLQKPGKNVISASDFLNGNKINIGEKFGKQ